MKKIISKNSSRKCSGNENITIDAKHNEMINYFQKLNESVPKIASRPVESPTRRTLPSVLKERLVI